MFCTECGKEIRDDSKYCVFCGNSVNRRLTRKPAKILSGAKSGVLNKIMVKGVKLPILNTKTMHIGIIAICVVVVFVLMTRKIGSGEPDGQDLLSTVLDAYSEFYNEHPLEGTVNFVLDDYDGDGIPELVISSCNIPLSWTEDKIVLYQKHNDQVIFLTYKNGQMLDYIHTVESVGNGIRHVGYDKNTNRFGLFQETVTGIADYGYSNSNAVEHHDYYYFSLDNNGFKQIGSAKWTVQRIGTAPLLWPEYYEIDGIQVSMREYYDCPYGEVILETSREASNTLDEVIRAYKRKVKQEF